MKGQKTPVEIIKPVVFISKTIKVGKLLKTMQKKQAYMAVVVDEYGGTLGIVTIEDIVEELVGEIWDEHDEVVENVKKENDGSFTVLGGVSFKDMLEAIGVSVGETEIPDTTITNWIMENLGRLPQINEILTWQNLTIKVIKVIKQRVMEVNVTVATIKEKENNF